MADIDATLEQRGSRYGSFDKHAAITQELKHIMRTGRSWSTMTPSQMEALEMVAHKIGRIVNGDPNYDDSWVDIAGYTTLVANELKRASERGG